MVDCSDQGVGVPKSTCLGHHGQAGTCSTYEYTPWYPRLDFAEMLTKGPINKVAINQILKKSLEGLT